MERIHVTLERRGDLVLLKIGRLVLPLRVVPDSRAETTEDRADPKSMEVE